MRADDCTEFLRWALPRMDLRWSGYRKVRRQVCKRIARRLGELGLETLDDYRAHLAESPAEWSHLDAMCRITISRFYRDRAVFDSLVEFVLPELAERARQESRPAEIWSAGCGSGEEPYSLALVWELALGSDYPDVGCAILATDAGELVLERARLARYPASSLKDLPADWADLAFERENDLYQLRPRFRSTVRFERADVRDAMPDRQFDLILCRNLVFTYFVEDRQSETLDRLADRLRPGGSLVIGSHEHLPDAHPALHPWDDLPCIYRRAPLPILSAP